MAFFHFFDGGFAQIFSQIASITVKKLRNTNFISSRHVKRENTSLPVDVRRSKTSLLKLPIKNANKYSTPYRVDLNSIMYSGAPDDDFHLLKGFLSYLEYLKISRNAL